MRVRVSSAAGLVALGLATALAPRLARAGGHREAPAIAADPAADTLDLFAWVTPGTHERLHLALTFAPFVAAAAGPEPSGFSPEVRLELHVADVSRAGLPELAAYMVTCRPTPLVEREPADPDALPTGGLAASRPLAGVSTVCDVVRAQGDRREILASDVPVTPPNLGPRVQAAVFGGAPYDAAFVERFVRPLGTAGAEGRVFLGPRDDPFAADRAALTDLLNLRVVPGTARDAFAGSDVQAVVLEVPARAFTPAEGRTIGIWGAASRRKMQVRRPDGTLDAYGPWVQVSRVGLPLINDLVIGYQDKDHFNSRTPAEDMALFGAYFLNPVLVREAEASGLYERLGLDPDTVGRLRRDRWDLLAAVSLTTPEAAAARPELLGDVLRVRLDADAAFPAGRRPGGGPTPEREPTDVTDTMLTLILTGGALALGDGVDGNDRPFLDAFPYLAPPRAAFTGE